MKIRSISAFSNPGEKVDQWELGELAKAVGAAKPAIEKAGYEVQTTRLATVPFPQLLSHPGEEAAIEFVAAAEKAAKAKEFGYLSLGPALPEYPESYALIPALLANSEICFFGGMLTTGESSISARAVKASAEVIRKASTLEPNGFANLRFAALANVPAGSPFFPAAFHMGDQPKFALATQAADLAVDAFSEAESIQLGAVKLTSMIEEHGQRLAKLCEEVSKATGIDFGGIDFSLAPFPEESESLGTAFERMGVPAVGMQGSLTATAVLTSAIDAADYPRTGFNGLLLPPLEDSILAVRAAEGQLSIHDLLLYSAVCGTGLDTIPLPGNSSSEQLSALLMDVATLALRLDKALTARLMPIPGKQAGDETSFDFDFFANSRVMKLEAQALGAPLSSDEDIQIKARRYSKF
jgi:hypothetical protein